MCAWNARRKKPVEDEEPLAPGAVTAVREHRRHEGRYNVEIGGRAAGAFSAEAIAELGLRVGVVVDADALPRVLAAGRFVACYDKATEALARRARSRVELERWLRDREFSPAEIEPAVERLIALRLLDDHAFATAFARSRATGRGHGRRRIAAELSRKGVPREVVDAVLADLAEDLDRTEPEAMEAAATRRARSLQRLEQAVAQRRLFGWLVRRGYDGRAAIGVARKLFPASR